MSNFDELLLQEADDLLNNFQVVSDVVLRGSQPDETALGVLKKIGVKLVVNLRYTARGASAPSSSYTLFRRYGDDEEIEEEKQAAEKMGLRFLNISLDGISAPSFEDIDRFVGLFSDPDNLPVYVHCLHGRERTGFMLAAYRMKIEGWSVRQAYEEMVQRGFDPLRTVLSDVLFEYAERS